MFAHEPLTQPHPLAEFDNVLFAPHCIAWTEELFSDIGKAVCQGMVDLSNGEKPRGMVNPAVLQHPGFKKKWERWGGGESPKAEIRMSQENRNVEKFKKACVSLL